MPYLLPDLGNPPIYATQLTLGLISVKLKEHDCSTHATCANSTLRPASRCVGAFAVEPFRVCHSIPDAVGFGIDDAGRPDRLTGDFKFDQTPVDGRPTDSPSLPILGGAARWR